jgi:hypothetical protein
MLLGKAAETIGVLSLEGPSRRWDTCQLYRIRVDEQKLAGGPVVAVEL